MKTRELGSQYPILFSTISDYAILTTGGFLRTKDLIINGIMNFHYGNIMRKFRL